MSATKTASYVQDRGGMLNRVGAWCRQNWDMLAVIALTLIFFFYMFGFSILNIYRTDFVSRGGDFTVSYLGSVFYRMDEWRWPIFTHMNLAYPFGISVHGTDGSPLLSLIFKVFHKFFGLPADVQYVGPWMLLSYFLQAVASVLIFRHAFKSQSWRDKACVVVGAMFFVTAPIMLMRVFVHINLMPHFILLFSILMYMNNRLGMKEWVYMAVLIGLGVLFCPYYLPMSVGFFTLLLYRQVWVEKKVSWRDLFFGLVFLNAVFWVLFYMLGMMSTEQDLGSGGWRKLAMNFTALFNPIWSRSAFFNNLTPKIDFDADNYFGLGLLIALILSMPDVLKLFQWKNLKRHAPLALLLLGFVLYALSPKWRIGNQVILDYKPGPFIEWLGSMFRYSGRFFWPVWYLLAYFVIKSVANNFRKMGLYLLIALFVVQMWDLNPTFMAKRRFIQTMRPQISPMVSKEWDRLNAQYQNIFILAHNKGYRDFWKWAIKNHKNVNYGFLNRPSKNTKELVNKTRNQILLGYVENPKYFYVIDEDLLKRIDTVSEKNPQVKELKSRIQKIDGFSILEYQPDLHQKFLEKTAAMRQAKEMYVVHKTWQGLLKPDKDFRVWRDRNGKPDYATIKELSGDTLVLLWDIHGIETFKKGTDGRYYFYKAEPREDKKEDKKD